MSPPKEEEEYVINMHNNQQDEGNTSITMNGGHSSSSRKDDENNVEHSPLLSKIARMKNNNDTVEATPTVTNEYVLNFAFYSFLGFIMFQAVFAYIANSQSMMADSEAMFVDALTYLFNMCAERIKNMPIKDVNDTEELQYKRELRRLYLELFPPMISVSALIGITIITLQEAVGTLLKTEQDNDNDDDDDDVSVSIMLLFSAANLLLDIINVTCFAKANSTFGLDVVQKETNTIRESLRGITFTPPPSTFNKNYGSIDEENDNEEQERSFNENGEFNNNNNKDPIALVNLNMCSAWTHVCADTLRSVAVLISAGIAAILPIVSGEMADSVAAIAVSIIIFVSLFPLLQGLIITAIQIYNMHKNPPSRKTSTSLTV